jgi:hypothetical protein
MLSVLALCLSRFFLCRWLFPFVFLFSPFSLSALLLVGVKSAATRYLLAQDAIQNALQLMIPSLTSSSISEEQKKNLFKCFHHFLIYLSSSMRKFTISSVKSSSSVDLLHPNPIIPTKRSSSSSSFPSIASAPFNTPEDHSLLVFILSLLQLIWMEGHRSDELASLLLCEATIADVFNNEIFFCLINIGSQWEILPIRSLQSILSLFTTLISVCGGLIRPVIEHFLRQVYLKALMKYIDLLNNQVRMHSYCLFSFFLIFSRIFSVGVLCLLLSSFLSTFCFVVSYPFSIFFCFFRLVKLIL